MRLGYSAPRAVRDSIGNDLHLIFRSMNLSVPERVDFTKTNDIKLLVRVELSPIRSHGAEKSTISSTMVTEYSISK